MMFEDERQKKAGLVAFYNWQVEKLEHRLKLAHSVKRRERYARKIRQIKARMVAETLAYL